jgi:hypothetical protein
MESECSREANSYLASHEILRILWNPNFHYRVYKNLPLVHLLVQKNNS